MLPRTAGIRSPIHDEKVDARRETELREIVRNREASLSRPDHQNAGVRGEWDHPATLPAAPKPTRESISNWRELGQNGRSTTGTSASFRGAKLSC